MGFTDQQVRALSRRVPASRIKTRVSEGKELSYIEGWFALEQANRIFGFDGWDRETIEARCIHSRDNQSSSSAVYCARVRVTVRTESTTVVRDGHGTGEARAASPGDAHDRALKAAETDATKRALATFGKAFGLALYNGRRVAQSKAGAPLDSASSSRAGPPSSPLREVAVKGGARSSNLTSLGTLRLFLPKARIDKSALTLSEPRRLRNRDHLRYVASQPCVLCSAAPSDPHHLRFAQPRALGRKTSDEFTVPLCRAHHRELHHGGNEAAWWHDMGIDPLEIARQLWAESRALGGRQNA